MTHCLLYPLFLFFLFQTPGNDRVAPDRVTPDRVTPDRVRSDSARGDSITFDPEQFVARKNVYRLVYRGGIVGCLDHHSEIKDGVMIWKTLTTKGGNIKQESETRFVADGFGLQSLTWTGHYNRLSVDVALTWENGRVSGHSLFPDHARDHDDRIDVDRTLPNHTYEKESVLFWLIRGMPFAPEKTFRLRLYDAAQDRIEYVSLAVIGKRNVLVPAGTFETWAVNVRGSEPEYRIFVSTETPRQLVKVEVPSRQLAYELLPEGFETRLREVP